MFSIPKAANLAFYYGAMSGGKSLALLQIAHNHQELGRSVKLYTTSKDDRYGLGKITTRLGVQKEAYIFDDTTNFLKQSDNHSNYAAILVDEAQFLTEVQVEQLHHLAAKEGVPVLCFGLRTDFQGKPFAGSTYLMALAEEIVELKSICRCGRKATMNIRIDEAGQRVHTGNQVEIGGNSKYMSVCSTCFYAGIPQNHPWSV